MKISVTHWTALRPCWRNLMTLRSHLQLRKKRLKCSMILLRSWYRVSIMLQMKWQLDVMRSVSGFAEIQVFHYHMSCYCYSVVCIVQLSVCSSSLSLHTVHYFVIQLVLWHCCMNNRKVISLTYYYYYYYNCFMSTWTVSGTTWGAGTRKVKPVWICCSKR